MTHSTAWAANMSTPVLSVRSLSVHYPGTPRRALESISFDVLPGQTVLVTGPSGSGKSTLTLALAGVIPESIEAELSGEIKLHPDVCKPGKIGYVFQDPETQFCMQQVDDEIAFGLENLNIPRTEMPHRIANALRDVGLHEHTSKHTNFSGGMKQKLAIASALALDAALFIFDEPTAHLDPLATRQVFESIVQLRAMGKTILIIEHQFEPLLPYVDRIVELPSPVHSDSTVGRRVVTDRNNVECSDVHSHSPQSNKNSSDPEIEVDGADLSYGDKTVWQGVSFDVCAGEWIAILGPNGSGKSSLLEVMAGLVSPTAGEVRLGGESIRQISKRQRYRRIGYGFQNPEYQFLFEKTCDEMAGYVIVGDTLPPDVADTLQEYGLRECAWLSPYQLSQGQKRRLAVAVMLQENQDIYLFDEPTYGQDAQSKAWILNKFDALKAQGKTVVTVTHDVKMVREHASRALVMADGSLIYDGSSDLLFTREDVLEKAHLLAGTRPLADCDSAGDVRLESRNEANFMKTTSVKSTVKSIEMHSPMAKFHPGLKLFTLLTVSTLTMFVNDFSHLAWMWGLVLFLTFGIAWCRPYQMMKWLSVLMIFYLFYAWTFAANAAVPAGATEVDWLWFHISMYGFWQGVLVALRTFATVLYAYVFVITTDSTDFLVSLSQSFRIPPKLSYAILAGTSFIPQINRDIRTLRKAKAVRRRTGNWLLRPATYALPLLSQAVRHSERMAIAMEARGFKGDAAERFDGRTYYRVTPVRPFDVGFTCLTLAVSCVLFWH